MLSIQRLAAQAHVRAALLNLMASHSDEGQILTTASVEINIFQDEDVQGDFALGVTDFKGQFHVHQGGSL